ncbi:hypothetical protein SARC_00959 [Sphaeroforma arctica JP610]|uniref:Uncharacterized protein n=1 Tax=Sphaeroforma arctica JP610 TaxID=667725 RepID=A0A0L0GDC8_9EUKA|nr:hypothetical protein SARC_00959 [Sphaeroforma arctica JP610]KNC86914.1 hypothetical protein SARC_00959 [Sphaeroforma arctica JP610]|eukprot:XP_014160816.1 hypothetical protein SARC_00959 [Sphaeroforma arctica JP610]
MGGHKQVRVQATGEVIHESFDPLEQYNVEDQYYFKALQSGYVLTPNSYGQTARSVNIDTNADIPNITGGRRKRRRDHGDEVSDSFDHTHINSGGNFTGNGAGLWQTIWVDPYLLPSNASIMATSNMVLDEETGEIDTAIVVGLFTRDLFNPASDVQGVLHSACINFEGIILDDQTAHLTGDNDSGLSVLLEQELDRSLLRQRRYDGTHPEEAPAGDSGVMRSIGRYYAQSENVLLRTIITKVLDAYGDLGTLDHTQLHSVKVDGTTYFARTAEASYEEIMYNGTVRAAKFIQLVYVSQQIISAQTLADRDRYILLMWVAVFVIILAACALAIAVTIPLGHQSRALELLALMMDPAMVTVPIDSNFWEVRRLQMSLKGFGKSSKLTPKTKTKPYNKN